MLHTRICDLLGIEHPIISAPMGSAAGPQLAAAVSGAGGFGMIGTGISPNARWMREQINIARELTDKPFGVGFISSSPGLEEAIQVCIDEKVTAMSHSFADASPYIPAAHAAGVKVLVQVQSVALAAAAARAGADIITAQGTEAGGHTGYLGTLPMVPAVIEVAGGIPVIAAGGIADGRGVAAVLMLGAEGAWIGTRFVASRESATNEWGKERVIRASADDTVLTQAYDLAMESPFPDWISDRVLRNDYTDEWHSRNAEVIAARPILQAKLTEAIQSGNVSLAPVRAGNSSGLISEILPAGDIVRRIVAETEAILRSRPGQVLGG
jgi:nitronate monooxygenase